VISDPSSKVIRLSTLVDREGNSSVEDEVALCFGGFSVIHPGHLRYFRQAKELGEKVHVALEGVVDNHGPKSFSVESRAEALASLDIIDKVIILDDGSLLDFVRISTPAVLVLGKEFELERAFQVREVVEFLGTVHSQVFYAAGEVQYADVTVFNGKENELAEKRLSEFKEILKANEINLLPLLDRLFAEPSRILVIGDTIIDRYIACDAMGMSAEAPVIVVKELEERSYLGGAGVVAAHTNGLIGQCSYLSVVGDDEQKNWVERELERIGIDSTLFTDARRPTTVKTRYMVDKQKLFRVSKLTEHSIPSALENKIIQKIDQILPSFDGVIISDFGYGMLTRKVLERVLQVARQNNVAVFGDVQSSSQIGNVLKLRNIDLISPTEREARIALGNQDDGIERVANLLQTATEARYLVIKLGADGFVTYGPADESGERSRQSFPALTINPVDVTGAGDTLLAVMGCALASGVGLLPAAALASCACATAVRSLGNHPVTQSRLREFIKTEILKLDHQLGG